VVLVGGSGPTDRDSLVFGIPILGQMAGALADAGFIVVRYDKRGIGQSGGRAESAGLTDYAEDVRAAVKMLSERRDVDPKRIAIVGHSEGGAVALIAASKEKRVSAIGVIAANGVTGAELMLAQQQHLLSRSSLPAEEKQAKIELQKRIHEAVLTGKGWDQVPADLRRTVDTPWFQSLLTFDPARALKDVKQPLLFVHGALDKQVPVTHADRLADVARKESDSKSVEVVVIRGVNHLLVPATTGEVSEYGTLTDRNISTDVTSAINGWLTRTFAAIR
jgi:pimeloyl-ACP methyl ester carboxylesterase